MYHSKPLSLNKKFHSVSYTPFILGKICSNQGIPFIFFDQLKEKRLIIDIIHSMKVNKDSLSRIAMWTCTRDYKDLFILIAENKNETFIITSIAYGSFEILKFLLQTNTIRKDILHFCRDAAFAGNLKVFRFLEYKLNANIIHEDPSIIEAALYPQNLEIFKYLVKKYRVDITDQRLNQVLQINGTFKEKYIACMDSGVILDESHLGVFIIYNYIDLFKKFTETIIWGPGEQSERLLLSSCQFGKYEIMKYILEKYEPDLQVIQEAFNTNLAENFARQLDILLVLLQKGAIFNYDNCRYIFNSKSDDQVRMLFKKTLEKNGYADDPVITNMYNMACRYQDKNMMNFLIERLTH